MVLSVPSLLVELFALHQQLLHAVAHPPVAAGVLHLDAAQHGRIPVQRPREIRHRPGVYEQREKRQVWREESKRRRVHDRDGGQDNNCLHAHMLNRVEGQVWRENPRPYRR